MHAYKQGWMPFGHLEMGLQWPEAYRGQQTQSDEVSKNFPGFRPITHGGFVTFHQVDFPYLHKSTVLITFIS